MSIENISGSGVKAQMGFETTYGTLPTMTKQIRLLGGTPEVSPTKTKFKELTGNRGEGASKITSYKGDIKLQAYARPDDIGYFLANLCGIDTTTVVSGSTLAYDHVFTLSDPNSMDLPSLAFLLKYATGHIYGITGCNTDTFSFSAATEDALKLDITLKAQKEISSSLTWTAMSPSALQPFLFNQTTVTFAGNTIGATSVKADFGNSLTNYLTTKTGLYYSESKAGARTGKFTLENLYGDTAKTIREDYGKTDTTGALTVKWLSDELIDTTNSYSLTISVPYVQVGDDKLPSIAEGTLKNSINLEMVDNGSDEPLIITLRNGLATAYIS